MNYRCGNCHAAEKPCELCVTRAERDEARAGRVLAEQERDYWRSRAETQLTSAQMTEAP